MKKLKKGTKVRLDPAKEWNSSWEQWLNVDCIIVNYGYSFDYRIMNPQRKTALVNKNEIVEIKKDKENGI